MMDIQGSTRKFAERILVLEAQCGQLKEENFKLNEQVMEVKGEEKLMIEKYMKVKDKYAKVKEEFGSEKSKWREEEENLREKCRQEGVEKRKLEIDVKAAKRRITNVSIELTHKLMTKEEHFESLLEETNGRITVLLAKNEALDMHTRRLEMESMETKKQKVEAEENKRELAQKIQVLEREKGELERERGELEAKVGLVNREKSEEIKRILNEKTVVEAEKRRLEAETKKKTLELVQRIEVLERENRGLETEICREKRERSEDIKRLVNEKDGFERGKRELEVENREIKRILNEKTVVEAEKRRLESETKKKTLELVQRIEVLQRENRGLETEICREKRERSEDIKRLLNEKDVFERGKRELEVENRGKDERIKVLEQEKECLAGEKKEMEMNWFVAKSQEDVELPHPGRNADISSTLTAQTQGPKSADVSVTEPNVRLVGSSELRELSGSELQKRKVEGLGCSVANQAGTKRGKSDGLTEHKLVFKNRREMFNAFTVNDKLCMRSVCALYRKYKPLGDWKDRSVSPSCTEFVHPLETRGMALGEFLTNGDPKGRLKKSLAEFELEDPRGIQDCRLIAWDHYLELFEIYKNKLDPLFVPGDEMN